MKRYTKKDRKKGLTTGEERSNISGVRAPEGVDTGKNLLKKSFKKVKKGVDKRGELRYTNEAVPQKGDSEAP